MDFQDVPWCCAIGCLQPARWRMFFPQPTPYTEACGDHVLDLGGELPGVSVVALTEEEMHGPSA